MSTRLPVHKQQARVARWRASDLTMPELARPHAIALTNLSRCNARYTEPTFARAQLIDPPPSPALVVELAHVLKGILLANGGLEFNAAVFGLELLRAAC